MSYRPVQPIDWQVWDSPFKTFNNMIIYLFFPLVFASVQVFSETFFKSSFILFYLHLEFDSPRTALWPKTWWHVNMCKKSPQFNFIWMWHWWSKNKRISCWLCKLKVWWQRYLNILKYVLLALPIQHSKNHKIWSKSGPEGTNSQEMLLLWLHLWIYRVWQGLHWILWCRWRRPEKSWSWPNHQSSIQLGRQLSRGQVWWRRKQSGSRVR